MYLLYIVLFLFPFYKSTFSVEVGIITFNPYSIGIIALTLLAMAKNIFMTRKYGVNMVDIFFLLFCLSFFVSTLFSPNIVKSGSMAYRWVFLPVISYFVIKTFIEDEDQFMKALFFLLAGIVVFSILGLMDIGIARRHLILSMPPIGAATLAVFVLITIFYSGWWRKKIGFVSLVFSALLLIMTYSRIYFIAILISPLLFYLIIRRGHIIKLFVLLFPVSLILALGLSVNPKLFKPKFNPSEQATRSISRVVDIRTYEKSIYNRGRQYKEGLHSFAKHPVIGTGIKHGKRQNVTTHNFHIEWLEYGGLLGYIFGFGIFASYFLIQRPYVTKDSFCAVNMCIISIVLMNCFFNGIMHGIMPYMIFIVMGLGEARRKIIEQETEHFGLSAGLTSQSE